MKKIMRYGTELLCTIIAAFAAILVHALLPSPGAATDPTMFDGYLVQRLGFPFVAGMYFVILYLHILIVMCIFGKKASSRKIEIGLRYGGAFGLMYLIGMQEVMVEDSPLTEYGTDFIQYQFFMGLGDAIPVFLLCMIIAVCMIKQKQPVRTYERERNIPFRMLIISVMFFAERMVSYYVGYIESDIQQYTIPVIIWTVIMSIVFAVMNRLLEPLYINADSVKRSININVWTIGLNWIWFNCFMGLILKGIFVQMFLRGAADVLVITLGCIIVDLSMTKKKE